MGSTNVNLVFDHWTHLSDQQIRALIFMAKTARDDDAPPVYFGGWEQICNALGIAQRDIAVSSMKRATLRVIGALGNSGCIVSSESSRPGRRADYALALDPRKTYRPRLTGQGIEWEQAPRELMDDSECHPSGDSQCHPLVAVSVTHSGQSVSPIGDSECHPHYKSTTKDYKYTSNSTSNVNQVPDVTLDAREEKTTAINPGLEDDQTPDDPEHEYNTARATIEHLPNMQALIDQARATHPNLGIRQLIIHAAKTHKGERP